MVSTYYPQLHSAVVLTCKYICYRNNVLLSNSLFTYREWMSNGTICNRDILHTQPFLCTYIEPFICSNIWCNADIPLTVQSCLLVFVKTYLWAVVPSIMLIFCTLSVLCTCKDPLVGNGTMCNADILHALSSMPQTSVFFKASVCMC